MLLNVMVKIKDKVAGNAPSSHFIFYSTILL